MTPDFFFQVFAKNSLMKDIFEEEKKFDSRARLFFWKKVPYWAYFGLSEDFKLTTKKVQDKTLCLSSNQDLFCMKVIRTYNAQPVKIPHFKNLLARKQARWPYFFLLH